MAYNFNYYSDPANNFSKQGITPQGPNYQPKSPIGGPASTASGYFPGMSGGTPGQKPIVNKGASFGGPLSGGAVGGGAGAGGQGVLSGPGYGEDWYKAHGNDLSGPSNTQTLFNEGMQGLDPYYNYAQTQVDNSINAQAGARGNWDSSATLGAIGTANADLRGQEAMQLETLANQADASALGRYSASSSASSLAQKDLENRVQEVVSGTEKLSQDQANLVMGFYDMAQKGELTADMAAIEAQMKAAGMDAAQIQAEMNLLLTGGGASAKVYSAVNGSGGDSAAASALA